MTRNWNRTRNKSVCPSIHRTATTSAAAAAWVCQFRSQVITALAATAAAITNIWTFFRQYVTENEILASSSSSCLRRSWIRVNPDSRQRHSCQVSVGRVSHLSIYLSIYLSIDLSIYLSIYLSICLSINQSIYLSINPSSSIFFCQSINRPLPFPTYQYIIAADPGAGIFFLHWIIH